jgi:hypothetical protein
MNERKKEIRKISEIRKFVVDKVSKMTDDVQLCRVFEILTGNTVTHAKESESGEVEVVMHKSF